MIWLESPPNFMRDPPPSMCSPHSGRLDFDRKAFLLILHLNFQLPLLQNGNGAHLNVSLWDLKGERNVFHDETKPDNLSDICRYWIGMCDIWGLAHTPSREILDPPLRVEENLPHLYNMLMNTQINKCSHLDLKTWKNQGSHSDWKTWKNGKAFSSQGKVRKFWTDWTSQGKSHKLLENSGNLR